MASLNQHNLEKRGLPQMGGLHSGSSITSRAVMTVVSSGGGGGSSPSYYASEGSTGSTTRNITLGANLTNGYVIVGFSIELIAGGYTTATFDGVPMTVLDSNGYGGRQFVLWGLAVGNKAAGTYSTVISGGGGGYNISVGTVVYNNVNQTTPTGTIVIGGPSAIDTQTANPASTTSDWVVAVGFGIRQYVSSGQTLRLAMGDNTATLVMTDIAGASGTTPVSITYTSSAQFNHLVAFALKP